jgi:hypothetical protein
MGGPGRHAHPRLEENFLSTTQSMPVKGSDTCTNAPEQGMRNRLSSHGHLATGNLDDVQGRASNAIDRAANTLRIFPTCFVSLFLLLFFPGGCVDLPFAMCGTLASREMRRARGMLLINLKVFVDTSSAAMPWAIQRR